MSMKILRNSIILLLIFTVSLHLSAQEDCLPKRKNRLVNDYIGQLSNSEAQALENKLVNFDNTTSTQIAIVIVNDLCGYDEASFTYTLAEKWGVGQKGKDNGIMIMVKPTGGSGQRHTYIEVGYGLEGVIPDVIAHRIVDREMIPRFKQGDIYGGLNAATDVIMQLAQGEFTAEEYNKRTSFNTNWVPFVFFLVMFFIIFGLKAGKTRRYARNNNISFWLALFLLSSSTNSRRGGYGSFSSGRGGFGGFSGGGGGFGGFGGGSFGGGGAGGSW